MTVALEPIFPGGYTPWAVLLRAFIDSLDRRGDLLRITREVDPVYETAAVIRAVRGQPVVFERVAGHSLPVVANVCASRELVALGLGIGRDELLGRLAAAADAPQEPAVIGSEDYGEIPVDLRSLPILTHYPEDGGPYVASGIAVARDPEYGLNASFHRAMVVDRDRLVLRIVERHLYAFLERGLNRFAYCVGNPISVLVAAATSVELGKSELAIANALAPTPLVALADHLVPPSEIVMLCTTTGETTAEGPFLDLTGTFDVVRDQPVVRIERLFVRRDPLFHALLPGDREHGVLMGMPREPTILREVSRVCTCLGVAVTPGGCSWLHGAIRIAKRSDDDPRRAIEAALRGHPSMKHVFVVDEDVDVEDPAALEWAMATRFQADRDLIVYPHQKGSSLDPSSDLATKETTKVGFDLTIPMGEDRGRFRRASSPLAIDLDDYL